MRKLEDECVGCKDLGLHCFGDSCPNKDVPHFYCDECGDETTLYDTEYGELCADCLLEKFHKIDGSEW